MSEFDFDALKVPANEQEKYLALSSLAIARTRQARLPAP